MALKSTQEIVFSREISGMLLQGRLRGILSLLYISVTILGGTGAEESYLGFILGITYWILSMLVYFIATKRKYTVQLQSISVLIDIAVLTGLTQVLRSVMGPDIPFAFILKTDIYPASILFLLFHMISINTRIVLFSGLAFFIFNSTILAITIAAGETTSDFSTGFTSYKVNPEFEAGKIVIFAFLVLIAWYISRRNRKMIYEAATAEAKRNTLSRYFSPDVLEVISDADGDEIASLGNTQKAAILFCDIKGFTEMSESLSPDRVVALLQEYHEAMVDCIFKNNGTLDKFIGDAIMASFGTPVPTEDDAFNAVKAALDMENSLVVLNEKREKRGDFLIQHRIGVHYGEVVAGNIGSKERLEYTVIGDTVNTASRIEGANKKLGTTVLFSGEVVDELGGKIKCRKVGVIRVKGKKIPLKVYTHSGEDNFHGGQNVHN